MDLNEYLDSLAGDGAMSAEDRTALAGILSKSPKAAEKAIKGYMLQSDYTKKTTELARDRERATGEMTSMSTQLSKALKDLEQGKTTMAQYQARLESINTEYGIDVSDVLKPPQQQTQQQQETRQTVDPELLKRLEAAENNYRYNPEVSALLLDAQIEYQRTFGNMDGFSASEVLKYARENKVAIRGNQAEGTNGAFERLYKIPEKRQEKIVAEAVSKALDAERAESQKRIDAALQGKATGTQDTAWQHGSPVLSDKFRQRNQERIDERGGSQQQQQDQQRPPSQGRSAAETEIMGGGAKFAKAFMQRRASGVPLGGAEKAA